MTDGYNQTSETILNGTYTVVRDENPSRVLFTYLMHREGKQPIEVIRVFLNKRDAVTGEPVLNPVAQIGWSSLDGQGGEMVMRFAAALNHATAQVFVETE